MKPKLLQQGAEAKIILNDNLIRRDPNLKEGLIKGNLVPFIIKDRISKSYRIPELDKSIRKRRTKSETKLLQKSSKLINVPLPLTPSNKSRDAKRAQIGKAQGRVGGNNFPYQIIMPFIKGKKLSEYLDKFSLKEQKQIMKSLGESIAKLHKNEIIHGDLTTSNMILVEEDFKKDFEKKLKELKKLNLPKGKYALFGSCPLGIRGIRKCRDIDVIVDEPLWQEYKNKKDWEYKITKNGIEHLSKGIIEFWHNWLPWYSKIDNFIKNADIIEGIPFVKLKYFLEWKTKFGREKDKSDVELLNNYLNKKEVINSKKIYFIDFGLGYISKKIEDKAVDLHLLKQALEAKHFKNWKELFKEVSKSYEKTLGKTESKKVFERITAVEKRGRYRH